LNALAGKVSFEWLRAAVERVDELVMLARRNIQKSLAWTLSPFNYAPDNPRRAGTGSKFRCAAHGL